MRSHCKEPKVHLTSPHGHPQCRVRGKLRTLKLTDSRKDVTCLACRNKMRRGRVLSVTERGPEFTH